MSLKDFRIIAKLGEGAYSSVYKVQRISDEQEYALKRVKLLNLSEKEKQNALNEVRILASIQSPYIVGYKEAFIDDSSMALCVIMEYAAGGDLFAKLGQCYKAKTRLSEQEIWAYAIQLILGLKALHDMNILHRDLKSANVFLTKDSDRIQLGDLNVSKVLRHEMAYTQTGTPYYASPEVWRDQPYNLKSDIWSLGCVIYEMCTLKPPFKGKDMESLYQKVKRGIFEPIPSEYSIDLYHLIAMCLQVSSSARPDCDDLLSSPFIQKRGGEYLKNMSSSAATQSQLLSTIRVPKNLRWLSKQLPKPKYTRSQSHSGSITLDDAPKSPNREPIDSKNKLEKRSSSQNGTIIRERNYAKKSNNPNPREISAFYQLIVNSRDDSGKESPVGKDYVTINHSKVSRNESQERLPDLNQRPLQRPNKVGANQTPQVYEVCFQPMLVGGGYIKAQLENRINNNHRNKMLGKKKLNSKRSNNDLSVRSINSSFIDEVTVSREKSPDSDARSKASRKHLNSLVQRYKESESSNSLSSQVLAKVSSENITNLQRRVDQHLNHRYRSIESNPSQKDLSGAEMYSQKHSSKIDLRSINGSESEDAISQYKKLTTLKKRLTRFSSNNKSRDVTPYKLVEPSY